MKDERERWCRCLRWSHPTWSDRGCVNGFVCILVFILDFLLLRRANLATIARVSEVVGGLLCFLVERGRVFIQECVRVFVACGVRMFGVQTGDSFQRCGGSGRSGSSSRSLMDFRLATIRSAPFVESASFATRRKSYLVDARR